MSNFNAIESARKRAFDDIHRSPNIRSCVRSRIRRARPIDERSREYVTLAKDTTFLGDPFIGFRLVSLPVRPSLVDRLDVNLCENKLMATSPHAASGSCEAGSNELRRGFSVGIQVNVE